MRSIFQACLVAALVVGAFSPARAVVIGTADGELSNPFAQTLGNFVYQQVYSSADFSSSISIGKISFYDTFGQTGGSSRTGDFTIFLSNTSFSVGSALGFFPQDYVQVFKGPLPTLSAGRLDFNLSTVFNYDPTKGNLLMTILAFWKRCSGQRGSSAGRRPNRRTAIQPEHSRRQWRSRRPRHRI
jgi:hypothetical protein